MSPPALRSSLRRHLPALLLALACGGLASGCGDDPAVVSFADYLGHQGDHVTSGLVSVPGGVNTHLLGYGWSLAGGERQVAELGQSVGHVRLFVAGGEPRLLVLRAALDRPGSRRYRLLINGRGLGAVSFGSEPGERRIELPPGSLRRGGNLLTLRCRECPPGGPASGPRLRLRQLRLLPAPANRRPIRRPQEGGRERFLMPTPAFLDVVAELPRGAAFRGELDLPAAAGGAVRVALEILDRDGERPAGEWRLEPGGRRRSLRADLSAWAGRAVRLRLSAAAASGAAELDWRRAVITGRGGPPGGGRLPIAEPAPPPRSGRLGRPDILLILLDAARADAFEPFGGPHPTPALSRLAAAGSRFREALSPSSWTRPSVSALFTGLYPDSVGAEAWDAGRPLQAPTLAELLSAAGYRTVLWHQHPFYRGQRALVRGFDEVRWARTNLVDPRPPAELLSTPGRPTFTFVHLLPPHAPYEPPAPFRGAYSSWYRGDLEVTAHTLNRFHGRRDPAELTAEDRRYIRDRYLENAAYADSLVAATLDLLAAAGGYEDRLIVVLSDHGEAFLEHGRFLHTRQLYRESIHVPLIVKWPASVSHHRPLVEQPVSLVDLVPTLVDGLALTTEHRFQGRSLLPLALDGDPAERPVYAVTRGAAEGWRPPVPSAAFRYGAWKAIYEPLADRLELYDVSADPGETIDLAGARPATALLLRQAVLEQRALNAALARRGEPAESAPLDPEVERQLRDLGYLGGE